MKKILFALCALALTGVFVSCNNGSKDYINLTTNSYDYKFNVSGTVETVTTQSQLNSEGKTESRTQTDTITLSSVLGMVHWTEDATVDSNYQSIGIEYAGKGEVTETYSSFTDSTSNGSAEGVGTVNSNYYFSIYKIDGKYFWERDGILTELSEGAINGDLNNDFTLTVSYTKDGQNGYSYTGDTDTSKTKYSVTTKYNLTFTLIK